MDSKNYGEYENYKDFLQKSQFLCYSRSIGESNIKINNLNVKTAFSFLINSKYDSRNKNSHLISVSGSIIFFLKAIYRISGQQINKEDFYKAILKFDLEFLHFLSINHETSYYPYKLLDIVIDNKSKRFLYIPLFYSITQYKMIHDNNSAISAFKSVLEEIYSKMISNP
jgi:hypothetical protein